MLFLYLRKMRKRVLIVETSTVIIQRLRDLVSESLNVEAIDISTSYSDASKKIRRNEPGIVLLDLAPEKDSIKLLREIKKERPEIVVIVLSDTADERIKDQCEQLGAEYFFDKYKEFEKIPGVIQQITSGR